MIFYIDSTSRTLAAVSDFALSDPSLIEVPSLPPHKGYKYLDGEWVTGGGNFYEGVQLAVSSGGDLGYSLGSEFLPIPTAQDLADLKASIVTSGGGGGKTVVPPDARLTFYVRNQMSSGNSGLSESEAFASIEEALIVLSGSYEVAGTLIIDLDLTHNLRCTSFPRFTGSGTIKILCSQGKSEISFVAFAGSTEADFANWSGLDFYFEDLKFIKGDNRKFSFSGGKLVFNRVDFTHCEVEFDNCSSSYLNNCLNSHRIKFFRSTLELKLCSLICEFYYCQLRTINCTFNRIFIIQGCPTVLLGNPRFNFHYYTVTANIINSSVEFDSSWLTFQNPGNGTQTKSFIRFTNCNLTNFPSKVDIQANCSFYNASILKFVNVNTPEEYNNATYDFSAHKFYGSAAGIELKSTGLQKPINVIGAPVKLDPFSYIGQTQYDNSQTQIEATTFQQAIDHILSSL